MKVVCNFHTCVVSIITISLLAKSVECLLFSQFTLFQVSGAYLVTCSMFISLNLSRFRLCLLYHGRSHTRIQCVNCSSTLDSNSIIWNHFVYRVSTTPHTFKTRSITVNSNLTNSNRMSQRMSSRQRLYPH